MLANFLYLATVGITVDLIWPVASQNSQPFVQIYKLERHFRIDKIELTIFFQSDNDLDLEWLRFHGAAVKDRRIMTIRGGHYNIRFTTPYTGIGDENIVLHILQHNRRYGVYITLDVQDVYRLDVVYDLVIPNPTITVLSEQTRNLLVVIPKYPESSLRPYVRNMTYNSIFNDEGTVHFNERPNNFTVVGEEDKNASIEYSIWREPVNSGSRLSFLQMEFDYPGLPFFVKKIKFWKFTSSWSYLDQPEIYPVAYLEFAVFDQRRIHNDIVVQTCRTDELCTIVCTATGIWIKKMEIYKVQPESPLTAITSDDQNVQPVYTEICEEATTRLSPVWADLIYLTPPRPDMSGEESYRCHASSGYSVAREQNILVKYHSLVESRPYQSRVHARGVFRNIRIKTLERIFKHQEVDFIVTYTSKKEVILNWLIYHGNIVTKRATSNSHVKGSTKEWSRAIFTATYQECFMNGSVVLQILDIHLRKGIYIVMQTSDPHSNNIVKNLNIPQITIRPEHEFVYEKSKANIFKITVRKMTKSSFKSRIRYINFNAAYIETKPDRLTASSNYDRYTILERKDLSDSLLMTVRLHSVNSSTKLISMELQFPSPDSSSFVTCISWFNQIVIRPFKKQPHFPRNFLGFIVYDSWRMEGKDIVQTCRINTRNPWEDMPCSIHCKAVGEAISNISLHKIETDGSHSLMRYNVHKTYSRFVADVVYQTPSYREYSVQERYQCIVTNAHAAVRVQNFTVNYSNSFGKLPCQISDSGSYFVHIESLERNFKVNKVEFLVKYKTNRKVVLQWLLFHEDTLIERANSTSDVEELPGSGCRKAVFTVGKILTGYVLLKILDTDLMTGTYITLDWGDLKREDIVRDVIIPLVRIDSQSSVVNDETNILTYHVKFVHVAKTSLRSRIRYINLHSSSILPEILRIKSSDQYDLYKILERRKLTDAAETIVLLVYVNNSTRFISMELEFSPPDLTSFVTKIGWWNLLVIRPSSQLGPLPTDFLGFEIFDKTRMEGTNVVWPCRKYPASTGLKNMCTFKCAAVGENITEITLHEIYPSGSIGSVRDAHITYSRYTAELVYKSRDSHSPSKRFSCSVYNNEGKSYEQEIFPKYLLPASVNEDSKSDDIYFIQIKSLERVFKLDKVQFTVNYKTDRNLHLNWLILQDESIVTDTMKSDSDVKISSGSGWRRAIFTTILKRIYNTGFALRIIDTDTSKTIDILLDSGDVNIEDIVRNLDIPLIELNQTLDLLSETNRTINIQVTFPLWVRSTLDTWDAEMRATFHLIENNKTIFTETSGILVNQETLGSATERMLKATIVFISNVNTTKMVSLELTFPAVHLYSVVKKIKWLDMFIVPQAASMPKDFIGFLVSDNLIKIVDNDIIIYCRAFEPCVIRCLAIGENIKNITLNKMQSYSHRTFLQKNVHTTISRYKATLFYKSPPFEIANAEELYKCYVDNGKVNVQTFTVRHFVPVEFIPRLSNVSVHRKEGSVVTLVITCTVKGDAFTLVTFHYAQRNNIHRFITTSDKTSLGDYTVSYKKFVNFDMYEPDGTAGPYKGRLLSANCSAKRPGLPCCGDSFISLNVPVNLGK